MEAGSDQLRSGVKQEDPEPLNMKEEEEEQLFGFTAGSCQFEEDEDKVLLSRFDLHQTQSRDLPNISATNEVKAVSGKWNGGGADGTRNPDLNHYEDDFNSSEDEVCEVEENDQDGNSSDSSVIFLSASEPKTKNRAKDWNESRSSSIRVDETVGSCSKVQTELKSFSDCGQTTSLSTPTGQKAFACEICDETFILRTHLYKHRRGHADQRRFSCKLCGQRFSLKRSLKIHTRIHTGERPFTCELCGNSFITKGALDSHTRIHTGEKPFACELCGWSFRSKAGLNNHNKVHNDDKPFACEHCGRRFNNKGNLNTHRRIHLGQKPFVCELCGKRFSQNTHVIAHMKVHERNKTIA